MVKKKKTEKKQGFLSKLKQVLITIFIMLVILYISLLVISQTDGFCSLMEEKIEQFTGLPTHLDACRCDVFLDLQLEGLHCKKEQEMPAPEIKATLAHIQWGLKGLFDKNKSPIKKISVRQLALSLARQDGGDWLPAFLNTLGPLPTTLNPSDVQESLQEYFRRLREAENNSALSFPIEIQDGTISWYRAQNKSWAQCDGFHFRFIPLEAQGRSLEHYSFSSQTFVLPEKVIPSEIKLEWLHTDDKLFFIDKALSYQESSRFHLALKKRTPFKRKRFNFFKSKDKSTEKEEAAKDITNETDLRESIRDALKDALE